MLPRCCEATYIIKHELKTVAPPNGATLFFYEYTVKDHLGNARVNFQANGAAIANIEDHHYYPFGMKMEGIGSSTVTNKYTYNYKELNEDFGLNWHDYGARWYDAALGRWWSVDPMAEKYAGWSPYNYTTGNPIKFIDPDGRQITPIYSVNENNELVVTLQVTGKVIDLSGNLFSSAESFASEFNNSASKLGGRATGLDITYNGKKYGEAIVNFDFNFTATDKISEISENDHLFVLAPYKNDQIATGVTNMSGGKVMHIDAKFTVGPIDDFMDNGINTGIHELITHGFGLFHQGGKKEYTTNLGVVDVFGLYLPDHTRGSLVESVQAGKVNKGPVIVNGGLLGNLRLPDMSATDEKNIPGIGKKMVTTNIGEINFDMLEETKQAIKHQ